MMITWLNYYSLKAGAVMQVLSTAIKTGALLILVFIIFFSGKGSIQNFFISSADRDLSLWGRVSGFIAAMSGALAAYDGWNNLGFVAGEIKNPRRNIPRGLVIGLLVCMIFYVLTNQAYLYVLPIDQMKNSQLVASDALAVVSGVTGGGLIALMVMISTLGAVNGNVLPCARITYAMGEQKVFAAWTGKVHPRFKTPGNAIWLQGIWCCMFVLTGSFDMLTDMFVFITWIFYGFAAIGIFILRKKMTNTERTYRVWAFPVVPLIFIFFAAFYFIVTLYNDINNYLAGKTEFINSVYGLLLTLAGIPIYFYYRKKFS
jgi:APA family basic amino acid/polyamine antiporter